MLAIANLMDNEMFKPWPGVAYATPWPPPTAETYLSHREFDGGLFFTNQRGLPCTRNSFTLHLTLHSSTHPIQPKWLTSTTSTMPASTPPLLEGSTRIHHRARRLPLTLKGRTVRYTVAQPISGAWSGSQDLW